MAITSGDKKTDPYLEALQKALQGGAGTSGDGGRVYMGKEYSGAYGPHGGSGSVAPDRGRDRWLSENDAELWFRAQSQKFRGDFLSQGILSGLLDYGAGPLEAGTLWKKLVKEASMYGKAGQKVAPWDLMASYVKASGGAGAWKQSGVWSINTVTGERRYEGPGTYLGNGKAQQTDTRTDLTDPDTARAAATKLFQDMMGRDPGQGELGAFASALHNAESNNPVVSTTTTQYDMDTGQALGTSTQSSGGVSADGRALIGENQIKKSKEYGAFQAATTYQDALESLVYGAPE